MGDRGRHFVKYSNRRAMQRILEKCSLFQWLSLIGECRQNTVETAID
jgi:hypothetical protein